MNAPRCTYYFSRKIENLRQNWRCSSGHGHTVKHAYIKNWNTFIFQEQIWLHVIERARRNCPNGLESQCLLMYCRDSNQIGCQNLFFQFCSDCLFRFTCSFKTKCLHYYFITLEKNHIKSIDWTFNLIFLSSSSFIITSPIRPISNENHVLWLVDNFMT